MSEGPSDPDLLDLDDVPNTGSIRMASDLGPQIAILTEAVRGLLRWAKRQATAKRELRAWALGAIFTVIGAAVTIIWQAAVLTAAVESMERRLVQIESARNGVIGALSGHTPRQSHESWLREKEATGWKYGPVKDPEKREHSCFVPYDALPAAQQRKDGIFIAVVRAIGDAMEDA